MVILAIMGLIVIFAGILLGIKVDKGDGYTLLVATVFLTGGLLVGIGCGLSGASNPEIILAEDINYKSIDLQGAEYYIVDEEGNIYEITQEQWNGLDVPIIPMINK